MKYLMMFFFLVTSTIALAEIDVNQLYGQWTGGCVGTQINGKQGHTIEVYSFNSPNEFQLKRNWYKDGHCKGKPFESDSEKGVFKIGNENTNNGFNPSGTYEVEYSSLKGKEKGLVWISSDNKQLRIARGFGSEQNTMLGLLIFNKK